MAISVTRLRCHCELEEPGGLLFGPPNEERKASKSHLCAKCYPKVLDLIALDPDRYKDRQ